jgi:hypothetical protein
MSGWSPAATSARPRWPSSSPRPDPDERKGAPGRIERIDDAGCDTNLRDATSDHTGDLNMALRTEQVRGTAPLVRAAATARSGQSSL